MSLFEFSGGLANILPPAPSACCQVNHMRTITVKSGFDVVYSLCVCAFELSSFLDHRTVIYIYIYIFLLVMLEK